MVDVKLSDEQKDFLEECEKEFKDRYTEKDLDFMKIKDKEEKNPPIVEPWFVKRRQQRDWPRQNQNQGRHSYHGDRRHNDRHSGPDRHYRDRFRHSYGRD